MALYLRNATASLFGATRRSIASSDGTALTGYDVWDSQYHTIYVHVWTCDSSGTLTHRASGSRASGNGQLAVNVSIASDITIPDGGGVAVGIGAGPASDTPAEVVTAGRVWFTAAQTGMKIPAGTHTFTVYVGVGFDDAEEADYTTVLWGNSKTYAPDGLIASAQAAPDAPTDLAASGDADSITLTWTKSSGATGYKVYRGTTTDPTDLYQTLGDVATYDDTAVDGSTYYYYRIKAFNAGGDSAYTASVSALGGPAPMVPTITSATCDIHGGVTLAITEGSTNTTAYEVWRSTDGVTYTKLLAKAYRATEGSNGSWTVLDVRPDKNEFVEDTVTYNAWGDTLYWKVKAVNAVGASGFSGAASAVITQDVDAVVATVIPLMTAYWQTLPDYSDASAAAVSTWNDLPWRAYSYLKSPNATTLAIVTNQWDTIKAQFTNDLYILPGYAPGVNIDHTGRILVATAQAYRVMLAAQQPTIAADMLDKLGDWCHALLTYFEGIGTIGLSTWGSAVSVNYQVDAPNQALSLGSALALAYATPGNAIYQSTTSYGGYTVQQFIQGSVDFAYATQFHGGAFDGNIPWNTSDYSSSAIHGGYHVVAVNQLKNILAFMGESWYPRLNSVLADALDANEEWFSYEPGGAWSYVFDGDANQAENNIPGIEYHTRLFAERLMASHSMFAADGYPADFTEYGGDATGLGVTWIRYNPLVGYKVAELVQATNNLSAPIDVIATLSGASVVLEWTDLSMVNDGYAIERKVDSGEYAALTTLGDVATYTDSTLPEGWTTLTYRIRATSGDSYSAWTESNTVAALSTGTRRRFAILDPFAPTRL